MPSNTNELWNKYYREGVKYIGSPFKTHQYVKLRLKGMSHEQALEAVKNSPK